MEKHKWTASQARIAKVPNFGKKYVVEPALLKLIGDIKGKSVLELGSGNGYWLEILERKGAKCIGIEIATKQIEIAKDNPKSKNIKYIQGDITNLNKYKLKTNSYDVILLEHVLLEIGSINGLNRIFAGVQRLLKKGGIVVISDIHPFAPSARPTKIRTLRDYNYFQSGSIFEIFSKRIDGKKIFYKDFHWTLEDLSCSITNSGLVITDILEPRPSQRLAEKYDELKYRMKVPMSIMIRAKKL